MQPGRHLDFLPLEQPPLAFVDVETTGVNPRENRITEIGIVTVDETGVREWTTVINPLARRREHTLAPQEITDEMRMAAPRFKDIAIELAARLEGRLLVAHNARFDYSFLKAEFDRVGIDFHSEVLCSLMLSRKLFAELAHHDLDSLIERHALEAEVRHRALYDAKLVWQFWQLIQREIPKAVVASAIERLRAGPLLPAHLHPSLIDRLPGAPGVYVFHGEDDEVLMAGTAQNLKLRVLGYFRLDLISGRALAISHRIRNVSWRVAQGSLGAKLRLALLPKESRPQRKRRRAEILHSWRFVPEATPCLSLVALGNGRNFPGGELFGLYDSPRKARNALARIAADRKLCHALLGLEGCDGGTCTACPIGRPGAACSRGVERLAHLTRAFTALRDLRLPVWPYAGPIGIRERADLHIIDGWRYLGTATNDAEIHAALESRVEAFDANVFRLLAKTLRRVPERRIVLLATQLRAAPAAGNHASALPLEFLSEGDVRRSANE